MEASPRVFGSERERLRALVKSAMNTRRVCGVPENFTFHPTEPYLYFIGLEPAQSMSSLYFVRLDQHDAGRPQRSRSHSQILTDFSLSSLDNNSGKPVQWYPLVSNEETQKEHHLSREEELLRERMRAVGFGITSYSFDSKYKFSLLKNFCSMQPN